MVADFCNATLVQHHDAVGMLDGGQAMRNDASWTASFMKSRWQYFHIEHHGSHVSFFNPRSLRLLDERAGFTLQNLATRNMRFYEKGDVPDAIYRLAKIVTEVFNVSVRLLGHGHDMLALMRRLGV